MSAERAQEPKQVIPRIQIVKAPDGYPLPSPRKKYRGDIVFTQSEDGQFVPIRVALDSLPMSPLVKSHLAEFVKERAQEPGKVYKFEGSYMVFLNGHPSFKGSVSEVVC